MKEMRLNQGKIALVDDEDFEWLSQWHWLNQRSAGDTYYVVRRHWLKDEKRYVKWWMHRLVINAPECYHVDHINGIKWDNRKVNLRLCKHIDNMQNQWKRRKGTSKYKGVRFEFNKWRATCQAYGKFHHIGMYETEIEAAMAYDRAVREFAGEFAVTNEDVYPEDFTRVENSQMFLNL